MRFDVTIVPPKVRNRQSTSTPPSSTSALPYDAVGVPVEPTETVAKLIKTAEERFRRAYGDDAIAGRYFRNLKDSAGTNILAYEIIDDIWPRNTPRAELKVYIHMEEIDREGSIKGNSALRPTGFLKRTVEDLEEAEKTAVKRRRKEEERYGTTVEELHHDFPVMSREVSESGAGVDEEEEDIVIGSKQLKPIRVDADGFKIPSMPTKPFVRKHTSISPSQVIVQVNRSQSESVSSSERGQAVLKYPRTASSSAALRVKNQTSSTRSFPVEPGPPSASVFSSPGASSGPPPTPTPGNIHSQRTPPSGQRPLNSQASLPGVSHQLKPGPRPLAYNIDEAEADPIDDGENFDDFALDTADNYHTYNGESPEYDHADRTIQSGDSLPDAFRVLTSSQPSSSRSNRADSTRAVSAGATAVWTEAEDAIVLEGIRRNWNTARMMKALPTEHTRSSSAIRNRKAVLLKKYPSGYPQSSDGSTQTATTRNWSTSELNVLRDCIARGLEAKEIRARHFSTRTVHAISHKVRFMWDTVVRSERCKSDFPQDHEGVALSCWSEKECLLLRRAHRENVPFERAHRLWFHRWPPQNVEERVKAYEQQMERVADSSMLTSTNPSDERPSSIATTSEPDPTPLHSQPQRLAGSSRQTLLNWTRDKGKRPANGERVNRPELDRAYGRSASRETRTHVEEDPGRSSVAEEGNHLHDSDYYQPSSSGELPLPGDDRLSPRCSSSRDSWAEAPEKPLHTALAEQGYIVQEEEPGQVKESNKVRGDDLPQVQSAQASYSAREDELPERQTTEESSEIQDIDRLLSVPSDPGIPGDNTRDSLSGRERHHNGLSVHDQLTAASYGEQHAGKTSDLPPIGFVKLPDPPTAAETGSVNRSSGQTATPPPSTSSCQSAGMLRYPQRAPGNASRLVNVRSGSRSYGNGGGWSPADSFQTANSVETSASNPLYSGRRGRRRNQVENRRERNSTSGRTGSLSASTRTGESFLTKASPNMEPSVVKVPSVDAPGQELQRLDAPSVVIQSVETPSTNAQRAELLSVQTSSREASKEQPPSVQSGSVTSSSKGPPSEPVSTTPAPLVTKPGKLRERSSAGSQARSNISMPLASRPPTGTVVEVRPVHIIPKPPRPRTPTAEEIQAGYMALLFPSDDEDSSSSPSSND